MLSDESPPLPWGWQENPNPALSPTPSPMMAAQGWIRSPGPVALGLPRMRVQHHQPHNLNPALHLCHWCHPSSPSPMALCPAALLRPDTTQCIPARVWGHQSRGVGGGRWRQPPPLIPPHPPQHIPPQCAMCRGEAGASCAPSVTPCPRRRHHGAVNPPLFPH